MDPTGDEITVETEIGPGFSDSDESTIGGCVANVLASKFPLDFVQPPDPTGSVNTCPSLTLFGMEHKACFLIDTYQRIEPGIIAALFILAIIAL